MAQGKVLGPHVIITKLSKCKSLKISFFLQVPVPLHPKRGSVRGKNISHQQWPPIFYIPEDSNPAKTLKEFQFKVPVSRFENILAVSSLTGVLMANLLWLQINLCIIFLKHAMGYAHYAETFSCFRFPFFPWSLVIIILSPNCCYCLGNDYFIESI